MHGREVERSNLLGDTWRFAWDSRDNMTETVDAAGRTIRKTFDELSRLTQMELVEADGLTVEDTVTFGYDAMGQKISAVDGDSSLAWSYDGANRVATAETVAGLTSVQPAVVLTHAYDAAGNRTDLTHGPDALAVDGAWGYLHDGNGSLTRVTMPTNDSIDLAYDLARRLERITSGNTVETQVLYDALSGRPDSIAHKLGTTTTLESFDYGFDADGTITSIADAGGTRNFTYDKTQQLKTSGYAVAPESYSYDKEGNRTVSHLSASYVHDAANRLREDAETCYAYDANGNLTSRRVKVGLDCVTDLSGATTTYTWDVLNRLTRIGFPDATFATYRYDAQGRRIEKDVNGVVTRYVYDGDDALLEYDGTDTSQAQYTYTEIVDQPLAMTRSGQSYFYHVDRLGSVRLLTDASGAIINRYDYDAFGNLEATSFEGITNPYTFTARERDAESGLMFYRARYYDPKVGRFISEDPIGFAANDLNLHRYVYNDPVNFTDSYGLIAAVGYGVQSNSSLKRTSAVVAPVGAAVRQMFALIARLITEAVLNATMDNDGSDSESKEEGDNSEDDSSGSDDNNDDKKFDPNQNAVIQLAREAKRKGLIRDEARALVALARQVGLRARGPEVHVGRAFSKLHIHIGPINHIPVI